MKTPEKVVDDLLQSHPIQTADGWTSHDAERLALAAIEADRMQRGYFLLSFEPDAIRDHFEADDPDPTEDLTDEQLEEIAMKALQDDKLYGVFHELLQAGVDGEL